MMTFNSVFAIASPAGAAISCVSAPAPYPPVSQEQVDKARAAELPAHAYHAIARAGRALASAAAFHHHRRNNNSIPALAWTMRNGKRRGD
ncbi:hypothetical protein [Rhodopseudomonas sp. B29]|uniref:hypothetical protein n=1 Tax=Rhodopseudomonas sp. B29 TaxID=95607 RepID=UPI001FCC7A36|nr:hypothetical protein [Rhodopseudomonas sp. B29]